MKTVILMLLTSVMIPCAIAADSRFDCVVSADRTNYSVGELPSITVRIRNKTDKDAILVGSLDGSTEGWRFPKCRIEILDAAGKPVTAAMARCGNMNALRTNDFVLVRAGDSFYPFGKGFFPPPQFYQFPIPGPGDYTVRFHYATSERVQDYFGDERRSGNSQASPEIQRLVTQVPKVELKSNPLKLHFKAKPK